MLPTEEQVTTYVKQNHGCSSKQIAAHFGCTSKDINRKRDGYPGIYKMPGVRSVNFKHFPNEPVPVPEPVPEPDPHADCSVCLQPYIPFKLMAFGCCTAKVCMDCYQRLTNDKCPGCRTTIPSRAPPDDDYNEMLDEDYVDPETEPPMQRETEPPRQRQRAIARPRNLGSNL